MIDPKLNEVAEPARAGTRSSADTPANAATPRPGLSINDTIAADANLSVGGQGADVSGVRAGAGAGAGSSHVSPGRSSNSPAPNIEPGQTGIGTTPLTQGVQGDTSPQSYDAIHQDNNDLTHDEIARHAYRCWQERGCPEGSAEEDWHRAERELRERYRGERKSSAASA
ncbi:MAG TPA: DUF2934 domain-containing protein [Bryobacteraceae bacterium]|jgi:hypothetical protein|nr:DUF2934 domain-containing protein [Bryobacteraceae bacterium]